jgi:thiosulfate/3-mercaptopyruvate sulfurtransferase
MGRLSGGLCIIVALLFVSASASDGYSNKNILISANEAVKLIGNPKVKFVSGDSSDVYRMGHIKGSVEMYAHHLHHADIMGRMDCVPLFRCIDDAEDYIGSKGIDNDTMIIAYDDYRGSNATGVYFFFKSYGHKKIKILNGGRAAIMAIDPAQRVYDEIYAEYVAESKDIRKAKKRLSEAAQGKVQLGGAEKAELRAYVEAGKIKQRKIKKRLSQAEKNLLVVKGEEHVRPKVFQIDKKKIDYSYIAGKEEMMVAMKDILENGKNSKYIIVDTRSMDEIIGERKMDNVARGGHIPGSIFLEWKQVSDAENRLSFKKADELKKVFEHFGVSPDKTVYAYCQVGAGRSTEVVTALKLLGYKHAKVYTGSWDEWGNDMNLPIKR